MNNFSHLHPDTLTIGVDASAPMPLHSDPESLPFEGFEVDLMKAIATRLKLTLSYRSVLWSQMIDELAEGKLDAVCTAATVTEARRKRVDFSQAYLDFQLSVIGHKNSPLRVAADLSGKIVGVRIATSAEDYVREHAGAGEIRTFHMNTEAYQAVIARSVDALVDDSPIATWFVREHPELRIVTNISGTDSQYAIMFQKGNTGLRQAVDQALEQIRLDGTYDRIYQKWFEGEIFYFQTHS